MSIWNSLIILIKVLTTLHCKLKLRNDLTDDKSQLCKWILATEYRNTCSLFWLQFIYVAHLRFQCDNLWILYIADHYACICSTTIMADVHVNLFTLIMHLLIHCLWIRTTWFCANQLNSTKGITRDHVV